ncbi:hypothetical protein [Heyndrickxia camelliae]|uniref:Uncharacterized protein n=1 Tax=Heyndrickxia camelliae TaxID=1707093 RepID=A0A2N3LLE2_9BACI|nr:hypothetical protein [Heyndrickxia camelliae]PKR85426.1 hypothetical protein CWO92_09590 [Heyndrickxia camelliae]
MSKLEELQTELANLKETNQKIMEEKINPELKRKVQEFLDAFEDYFRERGFVVKKNQGTIRVAYSSLEFSAFANDENDIFIMKEREQIASISVKYKKSKMGIHLVSADPIERLSKEIEKQQTIAQDLENPHFYYTGSEFGYLYETPFSVLDSIFHV